MTFSLGIKSDPIEYRYSYTWLFRLMNDLGIHFLQLGSFFELYSLEEGYFRELREEAQKFKVRIKSLFSSHRELGGFMSGSPYLERAARRNWARYLTAAAWLGADYAGSNMGAVYRDNFGYKEAGIRCFLKNMKEILHEAREMGLKALTLEPMSCLAEPPSTKDEIDSILGELTSYHRAHPETTVPMFLCADISHGLAGPDGKVIEDNTGLFEHGIPLMAEFHFKNTDARYEATFGFSDEQCRRGIIDLERFKEMIRINAEHFPVDHVVGYFETDGPKRGRDYSDYDLEKVLVDSMSTLKQAFEED